MRTFLERHDDAVTLILVLICVLMYTVAVAPQP